MIMKNLITYTLIIVFASLPLSAQNVAVDVEGNQYVTTTIGSQTWMAQNLRVTKYNNGDPIPNVQNAASWSAQNGTGAWSHYANNSAYDYDLGKFYNFYATEDARGLCPEGWRMPTQKDWEQLRDYLGGEAVAASGLKATGGAYYWTEPMVGDNTYGFNAVGTGHRDQSGNFNSLGTSGVWWASTKGTTGSIAVRMYNNTNELRVVGILRVDGAAVRCIEDVTTNSENPNFNNGEVPQDGLELYFEFDGNLDDDSPNGITLQQAVSDPASMYTDDRNGGVMSALTLNNNDDYLYYDAEFDETKLRSSFTISAWAKINAPFSYSNLSIFEIGNVNRGTNEQGIQLSISENYLYDCPGETYLAISTINGNSTRIQENCMSYDFLSQWNHYVMVFETGVSKFYINGELIGAKYDAVTEVGFPNNDIYILNRDNSQGIPSRSIDKLGVWSRAFSPEEVKGLYHSVNYNQVSWNSVETVTHGFNSSFTEAFANNNTDKVYKLKVSGTYGIANGTPHRDAAYNINNETLITGCDSNWQLDGQCPPPPPTAPEHYSDNHEYEYFLGYGTAVGSEVSFVDGNYNDNAGSFTFELFEGTITNVQEPEGIPYYIPTDELTAFYGFDGTADDESNYGNHGIMNGPVPTMDRFGNSQSALYFDGVNDYVQAPDNSGNDIQDPFTISMWYKPDAGYGSGSNHLISKWGTNSDASFQISVNKQGYMNAITNDGAGNSGISPDYVLPVGEWHHIVFQQENGVQKFYLNGELIASLESARNPQLTNRMLDIGFESKVNNGFIAGSLDEIGIWKRALTAEEVAMLYNPYSTSKLSNRTMIFSDVYSKEGVKFAQTISFDTLTYADSLVGFQFELPLDPSISADSIYYSSGQDLTIEASFIDNTLNVAVSSPQFITSYESLLDIFYTSNMSGMYELVPNNVKLNNSYTNNVQSGTLTVDPFIYGDVDENGAVDNYDAGIILHRTVGSELLPMDNLRWWESGPWFDWRYMQADVDEDGKILAMDAVYILQYIVGLITDFPVITTPVQNVTVELTDTGLLFTAPEEINGFNISLPELDGVEYLEPTILWDNVSSVVRDEDGMGVAIATSTAQSGVMLEIPLNVNSAENVDIIMTAFSNNTENKLKVMVNSSLVNSEVKDEIPTKLELSQNYPNPFNPSTNIQFALPEAAQVRLEVYNTLGQKVATVVDGMRSAGYHSVSFDASALSSGVYLYVITTPGHMETRKMMLIK